MRVHPGIFQPWGVRAILDGTKTQTRRIAKENYAGRFERGGRQWHPNDPEAIKACPYGAAGDLLWVREAFYRSPLTGEIRYRADGEVRGWRPCPSIHLPRSVSRLTLRVSEVRVERVQEISEEDAIAEGSFRDRYRFDLLWDSIHGTGAWERNDWVWVISWDKVWQRNVDDVLREVA